jgi:uncharacterized membrane protein HdeD (DUF308 family)
MLRDAVASWWLLQVRGLLAFAFGACLFFLAGIMQGRFTTTIALVGVFLAFVGYLIASGALFIFGALVSSIGNRARFWAGVGAIMLALGLWLFLSDQLTLASLVWFTIANALGSGMLEIAFSRALKRHREAILLVAAGLASLAVAAVLVIGRDAKASSLVSGLGIYALFYGTVLVLFSSRLRSFRKHMHRPHPA